MVMAWFSMCSHEFVWGFPISCVQIICSMIPWLKCSVLHSNFDVVNCDILLEFVSYSTNLKSGMCELICSHRVYKGCVLFHLLMWVGDNCDTFQFLIIVLAILMVGLRLQVPICKTKICVSGVSLCLIRSYNYFTV